MSLTFARVFTNGAVLQRGRENHIWGFASKGSNVTVSLAGQKADAVCDDNGRFDVVFSAMKKGGPYTLLATDESGQTAESTDIMIGDVIIVSGQSNMEFPMERVRETYPDEWEAPFDTLIRTFKVVENGVFKRTIPDVETGEWKSLSCGSIDAFSAVGFFTAKHLRMKDDAAVGLIDLTLGGAPIEAFMSESSLEGFDRALSEAAKFGDDGYRNGVLSQNEKNAAEWLAALDANDAGIGKYEDGKEILSKGTAVTFPDFFSDTELDGFIGSVWIAKTFTVPDEYVGKSAMLWFGLLVDLDHCYINGTHIGSTEYMYPPRRYAIPEGLIRKGENTIVLRIGVEKGYGRITPGKLYGIVYGDKIRRITDGFNESLEGADHIENLSGTWKYLIGNKCEASKDQVFVNWKPTALYHGMLEPLAHLSARAFAFYQGESNCWNHTEYAALTERFIAQLRSMWGNDLPYICVQLPEFNSRMEEISYDGGKNWRGLRRAQAECTKLPGFYLVDAYGTGELNDLHPQRKEPIGSAIADVIHEKA